jgi:hypothetical protein
VVVSPYTPTWFDFNFFGIDKLLFLSSGGTEVAGFPRAGFLFVMDNFTYNLNPVPEPSTMLLLGSGLIRLAGYGRKKFFKK